MMAVSRVVTLFLGNEFLHNGLAIELNHPEGGVNALFPKRLKKHIIIHGVTPHKIFLGRDIPL